MNKTEKDGLNVAWYLVVFLLIQLIVSTAVNLAVGVLQGVTGQTARDRAGPGGTIFSGPTLTLIFAISGVLTALLFTRLRWTPVARTYLLSKPWAVIAWTVVLALGLILPSEFLQEQVDVQMPKALESALAEALHKPTGFLAICVITPLAEEVVFRGAILRTLLTMFDRRWHWVPIIISAIIFGLVHGNSAQLIHAIPMGMLLGWLYYRTDSLVPSVILHVINNSAAYVQTYLLPPTATDAKLIDLFQGSEQTTWLAVGFSLCIAIPALFQLAIRLKKANV